MSVFVSESLGIEHRRISPPVTGKILVHGRGLVDVKVVAALSGFPDGVRNIIRFKNGRKKIVRNKELFL